MNTPILPITNNATHSISAQPKKGTDGTEFAQAMDGNKKAQADAQNIAGIDQAYKTAASTAQEKPAEDRHNPLETLALIIDTNALPLIKGRSDSKLVVDEVTQDKTQVINNKAKALQLDVDEQTNIKLADSDTIIKNNNTVQGLLVTETNIKKSVQGNTLNSGHQSKDWQNETSVLTLSKQSTGKNLTNTDQIQNISEQIKTVAQGLNIDNKNQTQNPELNQITQVINNQFAGPSELNSQQTFMRQPNIATHFNSPSWPQDFGKQIVNLSQNSMNFGHTVQMQVNPPELGPVQITLHLNDGMTQATFVSPHAAVRNAIENAIPNLQNQMDQAGISLGQTSVSDQQSPQQNLNHKGQNNGNASGQASNQISSGSTDTATDQNPRRPIRANALIDTFA